MIRMECDGCGKAIGRVFGDWFGLDHVKLDDDGELAEPAVDHEFHFDSADCAIAWLMKLAYETKPSQTEGTTT